MTIERGVQTFVGGLILSTGAMKLIVPRLRTAWGAQLDQAKLPLRDITYHVMPVIEIAVGATLAVGSAGGAAMQSDPVVEKDGTIKHVRQGSDFLTVRLYRAPATKEVLGNRLRRN